MEIFIIKQSKSSQDRRNSILSLLIERLYFMNELFKGGSDVCQISQFQM